MSVGVPRLPYVGGGRAAVAVSLRATAVVPVLGSPARTEEAVVPLAVLVQEAAAVLAPARCKIIYPVHTSQFNQVRNRFRSR